MRTCTILLLATLGCTPGPPHEVWIAFSSGRTGDGDVYAVRPATGPPRLLVGTPASEGAVRHDPHGQRLVHSRFDSVGATIMSGDTALFADPNGDVAPVWSSHGQIAFVLETDGMADVYVATGDPSSAAKVTSDKPVERYPAWDPGGGRLAYAKRLDTGWDLHVLDLESREETRLTFDGTYVGHPSWAPSGDLIAFDRMYDDQTEIVVLDLTTGQMDRLTRKDGNDLLPSWSPDGRLIVFAGEREGNWDVWTVTRDGSSLERITTDPAFDGGPIFVPASLLYPD
jgi:Tol biopolymer transport system component